MQCRNNPDLEEPLLRNGEEEDVKTLPKPPNAPQNIGEESTTDLPAAADDSETKKRTWVEWYQKSAIVPITCAIFLCFILKVVQQVSTVTVIARLFLPDCLLPSSIHSSLVCSNVIVHVTVSFAVLYVLEPGVMNHGIDV